MKNKNVLYLGRILTVLFFCSLFFLGGCKRKTTVDFVNMYDKELSFLPRCDGIDGEIIYSKYANQNDTFETIYYKQLGAGEVYQISAGPSGNPKWSPNGSEILFVQLVNGSSDFDIYLWNKEAKDETLLLSLKGSDESFPEWSTSGNQILFKSGITDNDFDIFLYDFATKEIQGIVSSDSHASEPTWSMDQQIIAYTSNDSTYIRSSQIYMIDIDGKNERQLTESVENQYDENPTWCLDDNCIIFERHIYNQNGQTIGLMIYDLLREEVYQFIDPKLFPNEYLYKLSFSATGRYITFGTAENFYIMDYENLTICPLNIQAVELSFYP